MNTSTYNTNVEFLSPGDVVVTDGTGGVKIQRTVESVHPAPVEGWTAVKFAGQGIVHLRGTVAVVDLREPIKARIADRCECGAPYDPEFGGYTCAK